jgi:hypothetical protein
MQFVDMLKFFGVGKGKYWMPLRAEACEDRE